MPDPDNRGVETSRAGEVGFAPAEQSVSFADVARFRQGMYRLLASAFLAPESGTFSSAIEAAGHLLQMAYSASDLSCYTTCVEFLDELSGFTAVDQASLGVSYRRLFDDRPMGALVPLYEAAVTDPLGMDAGWILGDIEAAYGAVGMKAGAAGGRRPDHVSVELEFLSHLCGTEAAGWEAGDVRAARRAINLQVRFIAKHLGVWSPALTRAIGDADGGFYGSTAAAVNAVVGHDTDFLPAMKEWLRDDADDPD